METNGAVGVNDELESDEIAAADCIIIAADKGVSMARFVGKRLVTVSAGDAVRNADAVLNKALNSKVPVYRGGNAFRTSDWRELGRETYRHLMNGISYMIPFVVVGGVMIALSLLLAQMGLAQKYCDLLNNIGKEAFVLIYPVLAASIAVSIGDAPAFMPGLMGGYMAQLGTTAGNKLSWVSSGFWGALIAGFAAGLLVRFLNGLGKKIPENLQQVRSSFLTPLLSLLGIAALMALARARVQEFDAAAVVEAVPDAVAACPDDLRLARGAAAFVQSASARIAPERLARMIERLPDSRGGAYLRDELAWMIL